MRFPERLARENLKMKVMRRVDFKVLALKALRFRFDGHREVPKVRRNCPYAS